MLDRCAAASVAALLVTTPAFAKVPVGSYFADVYVDGDKSGVIHFTSRRDEDGRVEEVKSDLSVTLLGFEVFEFDQHIVEEWEDDQLQFLNGRTNDNGDIYEVTLRRRDDGYRGTLNGRSVTLPAEAFPTSPWRYEIVEQDLLFALKDLELREVDISRAAPETVTVDDVEIETERFEVSGDWDATIWYDAKRRLVRVRYSEDGHTIVVVPERERADAPPSN